MSELVTYYARQRFKYAGRWYEPGDEWTPGGYKNDRAILNSKLVRMERAAVKPPAEPVAPAGGKRDGVKSR